MLMSRIWAWDWREHGPNKFGEIIVSGPVLGRVWVVLTRGPTLRLGLSSWAVYGPVWPLSYLGPRHDHGYLTGHGHTGPGHFPFMDLVWAYDWHVHQPNHSWALSDGPVMPQVWARTLSWANYGPRYGPSAILCPGLALAWAWA